MTSLVQKLDDVIRNIEQFTLEYINATYSSNKGISFLYKIISAPSQIFSSVISAFHTQLSAHLKYKTFLTETDLYVYVKPAEPLHEGLTLSGEGDDILTIRLKYTVLPKITYFETIPEDMISEILTYTKTDPGFIGSSESVKNVYKRYLNLIVNGYINILNPIEVDEFTIKDFVDRINIAIRYPYNYDIITNEKNHIKLNSSNDVKEIYYISPDSNEIRTIIGKSKNGIYFSLRYDKYGDRGFRNVFVYSKEWKYVWYHLDERLRYEIYNSMSYTQFFYLINKKAKLPVTL
jgi:hypothetical protein